MEFILKKFKRRLLAPILWVLAFIFIIEEAIWDWTARLMARLGAVQFIQAIEKRIAGLRPRYAFVAFMLPSAVLIPAKLFGLHAIASGHWLLGSVIFILAKFCGLALFSRIFNLTRASLMQLLWFSRFYGWIMVYRNRIHDYLDRWQAYQAIKRRVTAAVNALKSVLASWFSLK